MGVRIGVTGADFPQSVMAGRVPTACTHLENILAPSTKQMSYQRVDFPALKPGWNSSNLE